MGKEELLAEIEKSSGKIEPVRKVCQFQNSVYDNLYSYCKQIKDQNRDYVVFMGLSGGVGAHCWGGSVPQVIDGQTHYKDVPPCPYRGDDRILGWKIMIPADD